MDVSDTEVSVARNCYQVRFVKQTFFFCFGDASCLVIFIVRFMVYGISKFKVIASLTLCKCFFFSSDYNFA